MPDLDDWIEEEEEEKSVDDQFPMEMTIRLRDVNDLLILGSIANMGEATLRDLHDSIRYALPTTGQQFNERLEAYLAGGGEVSYMVFNSLNQVIARLEGE